MLSSQQKLPHRPRFLLLRLVWALKSRTGAAASHRLPRAARATAQPGFPSSRAVRYSVSRSSAALSKPGSKAGGWKSGSRGSPGGAGRLPGQCLTRSWAQGLRRRGAAVTPTSSRKTFTGETLRAADTSVHTPLPSNPRSSAAADLPLGPRSRPAALSRSLSLSKGPRSTKPARAGLRWTLRSCPEPSHLSPVTKRSKWEKRLARENSQEVEDANLESRETGRDSSHFTGSSFAARSVLQPNKN